MLLTLKISPKTTMAELIRGICRLLTYLESPDMSAIIPALLEQSTQPTMANTNSYQSHVCWRLFIEEENTRQ